MEKVTGLIAAPHTPMHPDGSINPDVVATYCRFLQNNGIKGIFLNGTTSEGYHLTLEERRTMVEAWCNAAGGSDFKIFVFAGHLSLKDACGIAEHAGSMAEVHGISLTGPFYQKPSTPELLVDWCATVAASAPDKPFYYYHIPVLTGINAPMTQFLTLAGNKIPNLAGVKFTHHDLEDFMMAMELENGRYDLMAGIDEIALASRAIGAKGYIGSTYNFMAPLFYRMFDAFDQGSLEEARQLQRLAIRIIRLIAPYGYISACKVIMQELGIDNGVVRQPNRQITGNEKNTLISGLTAMKFFDFACHLLSRKALTGFLILLMMMSQAAWAQGEPQIKWGQTSPLPPPPGEPVQYGVAGALIGISHGRLIIGGGAHFGDQVPWRGGVKKYQDRIYVFDPERKKRDWLIPRIGLPKPVAYGASVSYDGRVICLGGENATGPVQDVFSMEWSGRDIRIETLTSLPQPITSTGAALIGSTVYIAGGADQEGTLATFYCADLNSNPLEWQSLPPLPVPLSHAVVAAQGDGQECCIYVIGGRNKSGVTSTFLPTIRKFSPAKQKWEMVGHLSGSNGKPLGLAAGTGAAVGDRFILLFGGDPGIVFNRVEEYLDAISQATDPNKEKMLIESKNEEQENHPGFLRDVLVFNTQTGSITQISEIPGPAQVTTQTAVSGNTIYIPSGEIRPGIRTAIIRTAVVTGL